MTWRKLLLLIALLAAGAAPARAFSAADLETLAAGEPVVTVDSAGKTVKIAAAIDIPAPAKTVWALITDCAGATRFMERLKSCRVLSRGPDGRWDVREHVFSLLWLVKIRNVFRADYDPPKRMQFQETEGGEIEQLKGEVRLDALPNGGTRILYSAALVADLGMFNFVLRDALHRDIATVLRKVREASVAEPQ